MSLLSKLFGGGGDTPETPPEIHDGFTIYPTPQSTTGGYRLAARIEKHIDGEPKVFHMLRADTIGDLAEAEAFSIRKAKALIDEQGERIFD